MVEPARPDVRPDAVVNGPPDALVALFAGQLPLGSGPAQSLVTGDFGAVQRVVAGPLNDRGDKQVRAADLAWP
jgi:hypothetical protein